MFSSKQINIRFLLFKKLSVLGLFRIKNLETSGENRIHNVHLSHFEKKTCSLSLELMIRSINKLYPLLGLLLLKESLFLFINIDKNSKSFLTKIFYSLVKKIRAYCIYD
jgi:hypothetical protein